VCSEDSKRLIIEHISECEECRKIYEMSSVSMPEMIFKKADKDDEVEHQAVKAFKKMKKKMTFEAIMKCGVIILVVLMIYSTWKYKIEERVNVIPPSEIEVTEVYQLKNGDYYITLECDGKFSWNISSDNYLPKASSRLMSEEYSYEMNFQRPFFWEWNQAFCKDKVSFYFPKENRDFGKDYPVKECVSIQYVSGDEKEVMTIWEKGQPVKEAPEDIERKVDEQIDLYSPGYTRHSAGEILDK